jgi:hypothetical protein
MEEILASIRRILNDDEVPAEPGEAPDAPVADDDVLVLDETMLVSETPADHQDPEPEAMPPEPMAPEQEPMVLNQEMGAVVPAPDAEPRDRPALTPTLHGPLQRRHPRWRIWSERWQRAVRLRFTVGGRRWKTWSAPNCDPC